MDVKLFFATNRNHKGRNRWKPTGYGKKFSGDGHFNLRFGELTFEADEAEVKKHLNHTDQNQRTGDGEALSGYFTKCAEDATIDAYKDNTARAKKSIPFHKNSSTRLFKALKGEMEKVQDVLIYIHGYNVSWDEAVGSALALQHMLNRNRSADDKKVMVVLFSWPSNGSMMPVAAYKSDRSDAQDSAQAVGRAFLKLRDFLAQVQKEAADSSMHPCGQQIHLLCHSMGNYVMQNALGKIKDHSAGNRMPVIFQNIFLCAADVDDDVLEDDGPMASLHELGRHISIYFNQADLGMYISDYTKGHPQRLGQTGCARPQLVHNKVQQIDCSDIVHGVVEHSYYQWATVNDDIAQTINSVAFDDAKRKRKRLANSREWKLT